LTNDHLKVVTFLLNQGADCDIIDEDGSNFMIIFVYVLISSPRIENIGETKKTQTKKEETVDSSCEILIL
jgi:hypothetical protein